MSARTRFKRKATRRFADYTAMCWTRELLSLQYTGPTLAVIFQEGCLFIPNPKTRREASSAATINLQLLSVPAKANKMLNSSNHSLFPHAEFHEENLPSGDAWRRVRGIAEVLASRWNKAINSQCVFPWIYVACVACGQHC
jgi:hypothetical protein